MATTREEQIRAKIGAELDTTDIQIDSAFATLNALKTRLNNGKAMMVSKPARFDANDIAEVDVLIAKIDAKYTP